MPRLDILAWIVLMSRLISTVFVVVFMAMLPGHKSRNHPWSTAVHVAGRLRSFAFYAWPVALIRA